MEKKQTKSGRSRFTEIRLIITYRIMRALITPIFMIMYRYTFQKGLSKIKGPYIVLANHTTQLDPLLVGIAMKRHTFYVASEHVFRKGFWSRALMFHFAPIARVKGKTDAYTVIQMIKSLRAGNNVCMFAEGNRSFDGITGLIPDVTGKVIKKAGVKVVTFRLLGGYFAEPRWGFSIRKGKMHGEIANVYEVDELKDMSIEEINKHIKEDLYVDAYADQVEHNYHFKGKNRAVGMETAMFMCPSCKSIGTLTSTEDKISCKCGFEAIYKEDGMLKGMPEGMDTLTKWNAFQWEELKHQVRIKKEQNNSEVFKDPEVKFYRVGKDFEITKERIGEAIAYTDRLILAGEEISFDDIPTLSIYARNTLSFIYQNEHYEVKGGDRFSALKYKYLFEIIKDKKVV